MKKIKKVFIAYQLDKAMDDVTRIEVTFSDYQFTLSMLGGSSFDSEYEALKFVNDTMADYSKRGVDKDVRFVVIPTFVFDDDEKFKTT